MEEDPETIAREVARALRAGRRAVAFTGAGASAESGVMPFRAPGAAGVLWSGLALLGLPLAGDGRAWPARRRGAAFFYPPFSRAGVPAPPQTAPPPFRAACGTPAAPPTAAGLPGRAGAPPEQVAAV